ncbi:hypothetical protein QJQ45_022929 [Haematococcus lacustris]|nr:hypothetical protein QJQ45_022929 [Haematococcus lacustris]
MGKGMGAVNPLAHLHAEWLGVDPGKTNMATVAHEERDTDDNVVSQYYRDSGITREVQATKTWLTKVKPSSLASYRRSVNTVLETYDAMWAEVSKPRWANAKFRLYCGKQRVVARFYCGKLDTHQAGKQRWPDRILALAYGTASFSGKGNIGRRGVNQMLKEALKAVPSRAGGDGGCIPNQQGQLSQQHPQQDPP